MEFVSPPYFSFNALDDPWYSINREVQLQFKHLEKEKPVFSYLCLSKEILEKEESIEKILSDFSDFNGYVIWIDNFDETREQEETLSSLVNLVETINEKKKKCIILYGSYFSSLLSHKGLNGYCRNLDYGERKRIGSLPKGGGSPKKFYFEQLHCSLSKSKTRVLLSLYPEMMMCSCNICNSNKRILKKPINSSEGISKFFDQFDFTIDAKKHFILNISKEKDEIQSENIQSLLNKLDNRWKEIEARRIPERIGISTKYIQRWKNVLLNAE